MKIERRYTTADRPVEAQIEWKTVTASIPGAGFEMEVEVPVGWGEDATNIFAQKYLRKAGVPRLTRRSPRGWTDDMPAWLRPDEPFPDVDFGPETSAKQVFHRMAGAWTYWGWREGMFQPRNEIITKKDGTYYKTHELAEEYARAFYDELYAMLALQVAVPNSPQWFNTGLHWAYGIEGPDTGQWYCDRDGVAQRATNSYERPQPHACFLTSVSDDLVNEGGIMDLWVREARIFKHGSGSGVNPSRIRGKGEKLSGGGVASGVMSFLEVGDRSAGAIQSGGTTRRAAKMICLDADHPELEAFVEWKVREESKVAAMAVGSKLMLDALRDVVATASSDLEKGDLNVEQARMLGVPEAMIDRARLGILPLDLPIGWESESYRTVSGQNSNNSIRITDEFLRCVRDEKPWDLINRTDGKISKTVEARDLWEKICRAAWACADPGLLFHDTINSWNTCSNDGEIRTTNPCFTGDTKVWTINGPRRFDDLAVSGAPIKVLTELSNGQLAYREMTSPRLTQKKVSVCEVVLKAQRGPKGNRITTLHLTPDHIFFMKDGSQKKARDLKPKDKIESAYRARGNARGPKEDWGIKSTNGDYAFESVLIAETKYKRRPQSFEHIHHKNGNHLDNSLDNLEIKDASSHNSEHMLGDKNPMRWWFSSLSPEIREEYKKKYSRPGKSNPNFGNKGHLTDRIWINNGFNCRRIKKNTTIPEGWKPGYLRRNNLQTEETRLRRAASVKASWERRRANHTVVSITYLKDAYDVYCGTVKETGRFFVSLGNDDQHMEGVLVSNCAEFHHLDGSACNLASLNVVKFKLPDGTIDVERFEHACRLWTMVLDVSVSMASFPSREFAEGAYNYRTLGLGYANAGSLLMRLGLPYDSDEGRALIAAMTALMTGVAYRTSAELAAELGPFPRWEANREPMLAVIAKHLAATKTVPMPAMIGARAQEVWRSVEVAGLMHGYRNAQTTLIAPTGTISFVMGCDTTGIEPEMALIKDKNLAGGGTLRLVNGAVREALQTLGYTKEMIAANLSLIEKNGEMPIRGGDVPAKPDTMFLRAEHAAVFDCAVPAKPGGRFIDPMAHVKMVAAVQPFLSGAVSKTINLPRTATVEDVSNVYREAHQLGLKAVALYRDGSKLTQPLTVASMDVTTNLPGTLIEDIVGEEIPVTEGSGNVFADIGLPKPEEELAKAQQRVAYFEKIKHEMDRGKHEYLPWRRTRGYTQKAKIGEHSLFWRVSEYPDGRPGEIFITLAHEGSTLRATADCVAIAMSVALQHGVPLNSIVKQYIGTKFEPDGYVEGHDRIRFASSFVDLIARDLAITYLGRDDLANIVEATVVDDPQKIVALDKRAVGITESRVTGETCPGCGNLLRQTGTCKTCNSCGWNSGCG